MRRGSSRPKCCQNPSWPCCNGSLPRCPPCVQRCRQGLAPHHCSSRLGDTRRTGCTSPCLYWRPPHEPVLHKERRERGVARLRPLTFDAAYGGPPAVSYNVSGRSTYRRTSSPRRSASAARGPVGL